MFKKEARKITAFTALLFLTFLVTFNKIALAQNNFESNCKEVNGRYYIVNEVYKTCSIYQNLNQCSGLANIDSFSTVTDCANRSIEKYGCTPAITGSVLYGYNTENYSDINFTNRLVNQNDASACLQSLKSTEPIAGIPPYCREGIRFFQCKCSKTLVGEAGAFGSVISWVTGADTYSCYLSEIKAPVYKRLMPIESFSPIMFIKTSTNLIFYMAILVFLINLIRAGTTYIQSEGIPDDMKKGREMLTNTIQGMVFFLVVIGLIGYLLNAFKID